MKTTRKRRTRMRRSKKSIPRTRKQKKTYKRFYQHGSGVENPKVGKFYILNGDGFRPLYLIIPDPDPRRRSAGVVYAISFPPVDSVNLTPVYSPRGTQEDEMLIRSFKGEIEITGYEEYYDVGGGGVSLSGTSSVAPGIKYTINIPYNWLTTTQDNGIWGKDGNGKNNDAWDFIM